MRVARFAPSSIGLIAAGIVAIVLLGIAEVSAPRSWTFAATDGADVSAFYDTDGGDALVEFRNLSTRFAHIQYRISCDGRRDDRTWQDASQTSAAYITVSPDRARDTRWTCSRSWTSGAPPFVRNVGVEILDVTYDDHP